MDDQRAEDHRADDHRADDQRAEDQRAESQSAEDQRADDHRAEDQRAELRLPSVDQSSPVQVLPSHWPPDQDVRVEVALHQAAASQALPWTS
ncbi:MAG: hypothetical protein JO144_09365, partial [Actinobacteria bacterium]|nr:hypothetical protein [Actinomycetota bacterium]